MAVWMVRAGRHGEREDFALQNGVAIIGWDDLPDLTHLKSREELEEVMRNTYVDKKPGAITNWVGQVWAFRDRIQVGDLAVLPLKARGEIAVGRVKGSYQYQSKNPPDARHTRPVEWIKKDIPRSKFGQDLLYSLGAFMTVCQIQRNQAEERIRGIVEGKHVPAGEEAGDTTAVVDLEQMALDQIRQHIERTFKGHGLARLVEALLLAQGYQTQRSTEGPDGGVDILAGRGSMGFDPPRVCVQVKSGSNSADVQAVRELQGTMKNFGAEHGLFVSWAGFKESARKEARSHHFEIRLWGADELVEDLLAHYESLPKDLQAEFPLKRVWVLVPEE
jgi:restriction system protein